MYRFCNRSNLFFFIFISCFFIFSAPHPLQAADIRLIEAAGLNQSLSGWIVMDARPKKEWLKAHIPGAVSFSWEDYTRTDPKGVAYRTISPRELGGALGKIGIDDHASIAVYGDADTSWGGEGWLCWVLSWIGHKGRICVINGGIQAWKEKGFPLKDGAESFSGKAAEYKVDIREGLNISAQQIKNSPSAFQLVDTRSTLEWVMGHLPGAVHIDWEKFYHGKDRSFLSASGIRGLLAKNGINPEKPVVYYCTGGIRSGYAWLGHHLAGLPEAINFEGGTAEWEKMFP